jgi:hypothetical protein
MGFWSGLFGGSSSTLSSLINQYGQVGQKSVNQGQQYSGQAGKFWSDVLSGDASRTSQALAPQISAAKTRTAQDQKTNAMFGGRSGGTAAANASATDKLHSDITNLIGSLTNSSASNLANLGTQLTSTGLTSLSMEQQADAARMENWSNSILGLGITKGAGFLEGMALKQPGGSSGDNSSR